MLCQIDTLLNLFEEMSGMLFVCARMHPMG